MLDVTRQELLKYGENTSVRGIPKFFKSKDIFLKLLWLVFFLGSTAVMIYLLVLLFTRYYSWPVASKYGEKIGHNLAFPDITICNLDPLAEGEPTELSLNFYLEFVIKNQNFMMDALKGSDNDTDFVDKSINTDEFIRTMYDEIFSVPGYILNLRKDRPKSNDCPNFIVDCNFFGMDWFGIENPCSAANFSRRWNANYYTCYTMRTSNLTTSNPTIRGLSLLLNVGPPNRIQVPFKSSLTSSQARGVQVSVHSPGTPPDLKRGFSIAPGTESIVDIVQTERTRQDKPYNELGCTREKTMPHSPTDKYTSDLCLEYCHQNVTQSLCGCMSHILSIPDSYFNNVTLCGNYSLYDTSINVLESFLNTTLELICAHALFDPKIEENCVNQCLMPCNETIYETYYSSTSWPQPSVQLSLFQNYFVDSDCLASNANVSARFANYLKVFKNCTKITCEIPYYSNLTQIEESFLQIKFLMKQNFPYYLAENPAYSWDVMVGTVGGMLSLWLGITAASGVEVIELVYMLFKRCWEKKKSKSRTKEMTSTAENISSNGERMPSDGTQLDKISASATNRSKTSNNATDHGQRSDLDLFEQFYINNRGSKNKIKNSANGYLSEIS
ncbi:hypothetical protein HELRODRAFT_168835 [Helobdella robusta]|uniref:Uncharacterized protein n=1 Tax=Helobdella robusta TaxID=6412 RepID=T1F108_HELRO|nr:hypothetical protein HELRODRAFT_168835 [Helobdella robusta]ESO08915.1 hypothetical protein HELRODRAFT_168835 [Helobdella robusta]